MAHKRQKGSDDKAAEEKTPQPQRRRLRDAPDNSNNNNSSASKATANATAKTTAGGNGTVNGTAAPGPTRFIIPLIAQLTGYDQTAHAKQHDIKKAFVPFLPSDCDPPGTSNLKGRRR